MSVQATSGPGTGTDAQGRRLESWKEIATYLGRDVTTVRRWEKREGMPVHRLHHSRLGSVYAYTLELDAWRNERAPAAATDAPDARQASEAVRGWAQARTAAAVAALALALAASLIWLVRERTTIQPASASGGMRSLAVLPLQNFSGNPEQDYLSDGMTEALIARLSAIHALRVISRTSAMQFKGTRKSVPAIGKELNVDAVIEGSVLRSGDKIRVTVQLIRADTDEHLWSGTYDRELQDMLALQDDVAQAVSNELKIKLTPRGQVRLASSRPVDPEAYEAYLKGRYYFNQRTKDALNKSIASFQQAIARDPGYALAYGGLADAYAMLGFRGGFPSKDALSRAKTAALKAIELDETLTEPHASLAFIAETHEWDWATAEREYKRALELNPSDARAHTGMPVI
jgi:TolB-like protein